MLQRYNIQQKSIRTLILEAWEKDKEKLLRNLGAIDSGHRNEQRILQIEKTIESLKYTKLDDQVGTRHQR